MNGEREHGRADGDAIEDGVDVPVEPDAEARADAVANDQRDDGPWPIETWGPLYPEHFDLRTLDDLAKLPPSGEGRA